MSKRIRLARNAAGRGPALLCLLPLLKPSQPHACQRVSTPLEATLLHPCTDLCVLPRVGAPSAAAAPAQPGQAAQSPPSHLQFAQRMRSSANEQWQAGAESEARDAEAVTGSWSKPRQGGRSPPSHCARCAVLCRVKSCVVFRSQPYLKRLGRRPSSIWLPRSRVLQWKRVLTRLPGERGGPLDERPLEVAVGGSSRRLQL